jgi:PncC family amidohydrolase
MKRAETIIHTLTQRSQTLAVAESCTGGLIAHTLTNVPGCSQSFVLGLVAYSNQAKTKWLKVKPATLSKYGAVSEPVAVQMARGIRKAHNTHYGLSVTGIAGPTGGTAVKPVGLVYIAVNTPQETLCLHCQFTGTRAQIKRQAMRQALKLLKTFVE